MLHTEKAFVMKECHKNFDISEQQRSMPQAPGSRQHRSMAQVHVNKEPRLMSVSLNTNISFCHVGIMVIEVLDIKNKLLVLDTRGFTGLTRSLNFL